MDCGFDRGLISSYADRAAEGEALRSVQEHLPLCESCTMMLAEIRALGTALGGMQRENASTELIDSILSQTESRAQERSGMTVLKLPGAVWRTVVDGLEIDDERREALRRELPEWAARWVMFI